MSARMSKVVYKLNTEAYYKNQNAGIKIAYLAYII